MSDNLSSSLAERKVWLVKVPKYVAEMVNSKPANTSVGNVRVYAAEPGRKPKYVVSLKDDAFGDADEGGASGGGSAASAGDGSAASAGKGASSVRSRLAANAGQATAVRAGKTAGAGVPGAKYPRKYELMVKDIGTQQMAVFSDDARTGNRALEGTVVRRCDLKPQMSEEYRNLNRARLIQSETVNRTLQVSQVKKVNYKPTDSSLGRKTRDDVRDKRERMARHKLDDVIFKAFEKHQYYTLRGLVEVTDQPLTYLKEVLKDLCNYHTRGPHKNLYELKPEFGGATAGDGGGGSAMDTS